MADEADHLSLATTHRYSDPFGNTRGAGVSWTSSHSYLNAPTNSATATVHLGARDYDPTLGRFLTADQILDTTKPQSINGYELVEVDLDDGQVELLQAALFEWGGSAKATNKLAQSMGFTDADDLFHGAQRLCEAIRNRQPLSRRDWTRTLIATEVVFASDVLGSGVEWSIVTGLNDSESLAVLRTIQRRLVGVRRRRVLE
ncbi:MAG: hypothetical protein ACR2N4_14465 [Jatrophihabitans sp.]